MRKALRFLLPRVALSAASFVLTVSALELLTRLFLPVPAPVLLKEGVYVSRLPLVNYRISDHGISDHRPGAPLGRRRRKGELRVFVFGESSVQGSPWGPFGSAPTMLRDFLRARLPDRPITVVNMGRAGSMAMDAYYYLLAIRRYQPDLIIFYQGVNDRFDTDSEACLPLSRPKAHGLWRRLVERSHLLWTVRARGPDLLISLLRQRGGPQFPGHDRCDADLAFQAWTDLLVQTARQMGAETVVTTPVQSTVTSLEYTRRREAGDGSLGSFLDACDGDYRRLLVCRLTKGCDPDSLARSLVRGDDRIIERGECWKRSARRFGGHVVGLRDFIVRASPRGVLSFPFIVDGIHLSMEGNWTLAFLWSRAIDEVLQHREPSAVSPREVPAPQISPYAADLPRDTGMRHEELLEMTGLRYLQARMPLLAAPMLQEASERYHIRRARQALDYLRERLGVAPRAADAASFDMDALLRQKL
ncbi:MAG: SGNH/GDSL hydrolase family protein [Elusimicrobia bacterium]|nr:SGNH/GDSL hydrolase family protein [Elusimicrobiota bacterium]